jgi:hypothetical protein
MDEQKQALIRALMQGDALAAQSRVDPVREYLSKQEVGAYGDAGANVGMAGLTGGTAMAAGNPLLAAMLALGFGGKAFGDVQRAQEFGGAGDAFRRTGLPGAPMGRAMPIDDPTDPRVGRFANPMLTGGQ